MTTNPFEAFFTAGEAPAVDAGFRAALMQRIARRRLQLELVRAGGAGLALFVTLMLLQPVIIGLFSVLAGSLGGAILILGAVGLAAFLGHLAVIARLRLPALPLGRF